MLSQIQIRMDNPAALHQTSAQYLPEHAQLASLIARLSVLGTPQTNNKPYTANWVIAFSSPLVDQYFTYSKLTNNPGACSIPFYVHTRSRRLIMNDPSPVEEVVLPG